VVETLAGLNQKALAAYERRAYGHAMHLLAEGVRLCERPTPAAREHCARTHVNVGVVLAGGYKQRALATRHFRIARALRPLAAPAPRLATPEISAAFRQAERPETQR
jgi:hypothetical protein